MDYFPQPRPVLYGTSADEPLPQTQTKPVLTGPPRWPPAPPLAGFAPEPGDGNSNRSVDVIGLVVIGSRPVTLTFLSLLCVKSRPFATATDEYPPVRAAVQRTLGPSFGQDLSNPVSRDMPSWCGPRQLGQSAAQLMPTAMSVHAQISIHRRMAVPLCSGVIPPCNA